jgi:hypothetical protein
MKHLLATVSLLAFALPAPAPAQDAPPVGQAPAVVDPGQTASTAAGSDLETLIASIRSGKTNIGAIASLTSVGKVEVVRIGDLAAGAGAGALETAITENQADIEALQGVIAGNPALVARLDENAVDVSTVVAAKVEADGSLTVFAR